MNEDASPVEVYYNSACPVCKAGISAQQGKMSACNVQWKDVHSESEARKELPVELEKVRERLHVRDKDGRWQVGIDAFIALWSKSPTQKWKARLLSLAIIRPVARLAYNVFARVLYRWNRRKGHW